MDRPEFDRLIARASNPRLIPGIYRVEASLSGFKTAVVSAVTLEVNANQKVDVTLQLGPTAETVDGIRGASKREAFTHLLAAVAD